MEQDYLIAGHRFRVTGERLVKGIEALTGFSMFATNTTDEPLCSFIASEEQAPKIEKVLYSSDNEATVSHFGNYNGGYVFSTINKQGEELHLWTEDNGRVARFTGSLDPMLLRFACWIAFGVATAKHDTVAIHTSVIQYKDRAVFFLGESGTGKSTHTRLWRENIKGAVLLNDDSPILRLIDGQFWAYGSPWSGKTPCYKNERYPLAACVRLSQAPANHIEKLTVLKAYGALHPSFPPYFTYGDELYDPISEVLSVLLASVPVYHLACLPNAEAAHFSCNTIFGTCKI